MLGDTIDGYVPRRQAAPPAFSHTGPFVDGDNRVLLMLGTNGEEIEPPGERTTKL